MSITPKPPGVVQPPNIIPSESVADVAIPNSVPAEAVVDVSIPNIVPAKAVVDVAIPNTIPAESVIDISVPNNVPAKAVVDVSVPNVLTAVDAAAFPRTLTPLASLDFEDDIYALNGQPKSFADIVTFTRSSIATFINRQLNAQNQYEFFVDSAAIDELRFEFNPETGQNLGVLLEGDSTNLALRSEEFDNATWVKTRSTITSNVTNAPDGLLTADKLVEDSTASNNHFINQPVVYTSGESYAVSIYVKAAERSQISITLGSGAFGVTVRYDFTDFVAGTIIEITPGTNSSAKIEKISNGWFRCSVTAEATSTANSATQIFLMLAGAVSYNGDGSSGLFIWGAQIEELPFASSYIKTLGSSVTRSADNMSMSASDALQIGEKSIYVKFDFEKITSYNAVIYDTDGTNDIRGLIGNLGTSLTFRHGNNTPSINTSDTDENIKFTGVYDGVAGMTSYINGQSVSNNLGVASVDNTVFSIGATTGFASNFFGHISTLTTYNLELTAQEVSLL